jgi:hypothetical protein
VLAASKNLLTAALVVVVCLAANLQASGQSSGNSGSINGTVLDPSGAVVANATVKIHNPVSQYDRSASTDNNGNFGFSNLPFNPYHMTVSAPGFATSVKDVDVRSAVPMNLTVSLQMTGSTTSVTVEGTATDLLENDPTFHTDVDRNLFNRVPLESQSSSLSSLVTLTTPGVAADSNGLFHGLGEHAGDSYSVDGQPITDQQSKVFSNQISLGSIQSLEVIEGAPPAEFGGKTSVVIVATTRSGQGVTTPHGSITTSYGTFGTSTLAADLAYGGKTWGNFISVDGLNTGRFLDSPEFVVLHSEGNEENIFDRVDYSFSDKDSGHLNLEFTRSWFQTPNSWDQQLQTCTVLSTDCNTAGTTQVNPITGVPLAATDQRSQIRTFNIAPVWTHVLDSASIVTLGAFVRRDQYNYYPSNNFFSDLGPLQDETISQLRFLTNAGVRGSWSHAKGINNIKAGATYGQTFLTENDSFGIVNPGLLPGCPSSLATQCAILVPYDLTTGGTLYRYRGHTDVKELGFYLQDTITKNAWTFNLGLRADLYNGLDAAAQQLQPRAGLAYHITRTNTVLRVSYARTLDSPFNENLILSGTGCNNPVVNAVIVVAQTLACITTPLVPGFRNEFHAGLEQALSRYVVVSGEYIWKYTHNGADFNVFGTTPITLPIEWHNAKIQGFAIRGSVPDFHGLSALIVMSHISARFFPPTVAGIAPPPPPAVFRIDHDEKFNQTTHIQYQPGKRGLWLGFNWRYDSGLVAGFVPCEAQTVTCSFSTSNQDPGGVGLAKVPAGYIALVNNLNGLSLTADQEFQSGITCDGIRATPTVPTGIVIPGQPYRACLATQLTSSLVKIPAPNTQQDDHNPQRIQPRNLFDLSIGDDNLFHGDRYKVSLQLTAINIANNYVLYNFLSTFSGTHYVTPRTLTAQIGLHF